MSQINPSWLDKSHDFFSWTFKLQINCTWVIVIYIRFHRKGRHQKLQSAAADGTSFPRRFYSLIHWGGKSTDKSSFELIFQHCGGLTWAQYRRRNDKSKDENVSLFSWWIVINCIVWWNDPVQCPPVFRRFCLKIFCWWHRDTQQFARTKDKNAWLM